MIREISFPETKDNHWQSDEAFVSFLAETVIRECNDDDKVLIGCNDYFSIRNLATEIENYNERSENQRSHLSYLIIHDHKDALHSLPNHLKDVPEDLTQRKERIYIHQRKLLEGVDDSNFRFLFIRDVIENQRNLIQQIGRISRTRKEVKIDTGIEAKKGFVYAKPSWKLNEQWQNYLEADSKGYIKSASQLISEMMSQYESRASENSDSDSKNISNLDDTAQLYVLGKLRKNLFFEIGRKNLNPKEQMRIEKTTSIYKLVNKNEDIQEYLKKGIISKRISEDKQLIYEENIPVTNDSGDAYTFYLLIFATVDLNSNFPEHFIPNPSVYIDIFMQKEDVLFSLKNISGLAEYEDEDISESSPLLSNTSNEKKDKFNLASRKDMMKLLNTENDNAELHVRNLALANSNLVSRVVSTKTISASALEETIPGFDDYAHVFTRVKAKLVGDEDYRTRYIGFANARVTENNCIKVKLNDYFDWIIELYNIIKKNKNKKNENTKSFFNRFAEESDVPKKSPEPINIMLNAEEIDSAFYNKNDTSDHNYFTFNEICLDIAPRMNNSKLRYFFELINDSNSEKYTLEIVPSKKKYILRSSELDNKYIQDESRTEYKSITSYFNKTQNFRVLTKNNKFMYFMRSFYKPKLRTGGDFNSNDDHLMNSIEANSIFAEIDSEKGDKDSYVGDGNHADWIEKSQFGLISRCCKDKNYKYIDQTGKINSLDFSSYIENVSLAICTDMSTEVADFIICDKKSLKVIFIHAKAESKDSIVRGKMCSVSKLKEVIMQLQKNLEYFGLFSDSLPGNLESWTDPWYLVKAKPEEERSYVQNRIICGFKEGYEGKDYWADIRKLINNPNCQKEAWLFTSKIISKSHLIEQLSKTKPKANIIQATFLLNVTMAMTTSVGARLRIFCNE
jgi:hypothetical protein